MHHCTVLWGIRSLFFPKKTKRQICVSLLTFKYWIMFPNVVPLKMVLKHWLKVLNSISEWYNLENSKFGLLVIFRRWSVDSRWKDPIFEWNYLPDKIPSKLALKRWLSIFNSISELYKLENSDFGICVHVMVLKRWLKVWNYLHNTVVSYSLKRYIITQVHMRLCDFPLIT